MENIIQSLLPLNKLSKYIAVKEIIESNEESIDYGLVLTINDATQLIETRNKALDTNGRIEIGSGTIRKIIDAFYDSAYINQVDYTDILNELLEIFYYIKNETLDLIPDDDLIEIMKNYFNNSCEGSLLLLKNRELEIMARNIRFNIANYLNIDEFDNKVLIEEEF